ncbi:MAG: nucleotidyltransferase family protein [Oscillospiraceae bacterium]
MKTAAVICEYNPFHYGHRHQLEQTRALGATHIVAVMSGDFTQRGDLAVTDKFARAKTALENGCRPRAGASREVQPVRCRGFAGRGG